MTLQTKVRLGWKYRRVLWKYRNLIRHRREIAWAAGTAMGIGAVALLRAHSKPVS